MKSKPHTKAQKLADRFKEIGLERYDLSHRDWLKFYAGKGKIVVEWIKVGDDHSTPPKTIRVKHVRLMETRKVSDE